jgi:ABC-2 type transport system ATP-binding protein
MLALDIQGLRKKYSGGVEALKSVSFQVEQGDFFALLGPNGAGKSTTIGITCSLVKKTAGKVLVFGRDLDKEPNAVKKCIGVVPQEFNFNIFEPVEQILINQAGFYGIEPSVARKRAEYYLKKMGLWDKREEKAGKLSGGMKRRLLIVRALVHEPPLLILDEPTAGVDIELRRLLWDFLKELNSRGTTIILTTHYLEEAEHLCRNIAIIDQGDIIENTTMKQLLQTINTEIFVFYLKNSLKENPALTNFSSHLVDETTLEVELASKQSLNALFNELAKHHIEVLSMRNKSNRLEELFIKLVSDNKNGRDHGPDVLEQIVGGKDVP